MTAYGTGRTTNDKATIPAGISRRSVPLGVAAGVGGLQVLLGFHLGDTRNSVGVQNQPAAWKNMNYSQMRDALRGYVDRSLNVMKSAGVTPGWVKIDNEQNSGICKPVGSVSNPAAAMDGFLNV